MKRTRTERAKQAEELLLREVPVVYPATGEAQEKRREHPVMIMYHLWAEEVRELQPLRDKINVLTEKLKETQLELSKLKRGKK
jgi:hypothetical protein